MRNVVTGTMSRAFAAVTAGGCALLLAAGLSGCSLITPTRAAVERETVPAAVSTPSIMESGTLTVAVDTTDAPQAMTDAEGDAVGYNVDVACILAQRLGLEVKVVTAVTARDALSNGKADVFVGASTRDATDDITVAGEIGQDASAIFGLSSDGSRSVSGVSASDLASSVIAVQSSSASQDALTRAGITATQRTFSNVNECFEALVAGEVQYVACDVTAGGYLARAYEGVGLVGTVAAATSYGVAVDATNTELLTAVQDALDTMGSDGTVDAVHAAWYGPAPCDLSDAMLAGVTVTSSDQADGQEVDGDTAVATGRAITHDINSRD